MYKNGILNQVPLCFILQDIMMSRDLDSNGCISFDEFLLAMPANSLISDEEHKYDIVPNVFFKIQCHMKF